MKRSALAAAADVATVLVAGAAVSMVALNVYDRFAAEARSAGPPVENRRLAEAEWQALVNDGRRIGPDSAVVEIVVFSDYECPFCRRAEPRFAALRDAFPGEVAFVYRHWPLQIHRHAYQAARYAECGAAQGRFMEVHSILFRMESLADLDASEVAVAAQLAHPDAFITCAQQRSAVPHIDRDISLALELGLLGTPSVIVNGVLYGTPPDSVELRQIVTRFLAADRR